MPISITSEHPLPSTLADWFARAQKEKPELDIAIRASPIHLHLHASSADLPDLTLNFCDTQHQFLAQSLSKKQPIWRALQWKKPQTPYLFDTTAGFGQDSFIFAHLGAKVVSIERDPLIAALLGYAVEMLKKTKPQLDWEVHLGDAKTWLHNTTLTPTHIYLDPFFHKKNSAKPKNTMQWLQFITQEKQPCPEELFKQACGMPCSHIIVKRAKEAPFLLNQKPDRGSILQKASRFDCYSARPHPS
jgi:16S rRNA (guanine1516-N2)-methyltransferase